ncbi:hypothetical protein ATY35_09715 [Vibrio cidicii]|uniref:Uncharacterized protein n=1 Tax=Vibrio cidicii TaxID=1763883 RepID=A0ABR5W5S2_9VIBR|nr:LamG-like jellyroll fold domain-containing protein [Vibrio cidicii]KYN90558.1 hypothetical protein ATY35_09715 [Vibrio cidicii]
MTWINLPSVSVQSGSKTVTVSNAQTTHIKAGDALLIGNYQPVEISGVFATQLTLRENWSNATQTNVVAVVMPTSGDFVTATKVLKEATETTRSNFAALEKWATQMGTVEFKGQDNTTHTGRTFKQMDEDVKALETGLSTVVANKIAEVVNVDWDLFIPFNDSGRIERGFGEHDTIDVGGSIIELPTKSVSFSRASARTVISKSGEVETIAVDKLAIGRDGAEFYQEYTSLFLKNNDLDTAPWTQSTKTVTEDTTESEKIGLKVWKIVPDYSPTARINNGPIQNITLSPGTYTATYLIKADELSIINFGSSINWSPSSGYQLCRVDFRDGRITDGSQYVTQFEHIKDGFYLFSHKFVVDQTANSLITCQIYSNDSKQVWAPNGTDGIYFCFAQLTATAAPMPYINTSGAAVTSAPDVCELQVRNNLPPIYSSFSVLIDAKIGQYVGGSSTNLFRAYGKGFESVYIRRSSNTEALLAFYDGSTTNTVYFPIDFSAHRIIFTYENRTASIFVDGMKLGTNSNITVNEFYNPNGKIVLGGASPSLLKLNGSIKTLGIIHRALSDDEIKALGAAK